MAATKHRLAESEPSSRTGAGNDSARPVKKSKLDGSADVDSEASLKESNERQRRSKDKKEKKAKKEKDESVHGRAHDDSAESKCSTENVNGKQTESEAERRARKDLKKAKKRAKQEKKHKEIEMKAARVQDDVEIEGPEAGHHAAAPSSAEGPKRSKRDKKNKAKTVDTDEADAVVDASSNTHYTQTMSLSNLPQAEVDEFLSTNEIAVNDPKTKTNIPRPVLDFFHLPSTNLLERKPSPFANFSKPTPIQAASWPFTLSGRDVIGVAETGSGKTMAFALPCVELVSALGKRGVKAVIVSPTRELAMQTHQQLAALAALVKVECVCIYGGASKDDQRALLKRGADIVVATPGRLKDFMSDQTVVLSEVRFVVLDEADRMLDKGFEEDIKQILGSCPPRGLRQTLMFTATWPASVQSLASTFMKNPVKVTIGSGGKESANGGVELQANARISQSVEVLGPRDKEFRLLQILKQRQQGKGKNDRILVFCLYKKEATRVENFLSRKGVKVAGIHGDLRQEQRTRSLEAFKSGHTPVLVATDVAARGLDIPEVKLVINVTVSGETGSVASGPCRHGNVMSDRCAVSPDH